MTPHITEETSIRSVDRFALAGNIKPPRDPEAEDEEDDRADEPPVVREPDGDYLEHDAFGLGIACATSICMDLPVRIQNHLELNGLSQKVPSEICSWWLNSWQSTVAPYDHFHRSSSDEVSIQAAHKAGAASAIVSAA